MHRIFKMQNTIQPYAWGSRSAIADLLGSSCPSDQPQAELWMGAHPKGPSKVWHHNSWETLDGLIQQAPQAILGSDVISRFGTHLPFLFKILAADQPLSIQAHPSLEMARQGFVRENEQGIPLSAPHRNYKDNQHKPECICALPSFWAMSGFRQPQDMRIMLEPVWPSERRDDLALLKAAEEGRGIQSFFHFLMRLSQKPLKQLIRHVVAKAQSLKDQNQTDQTYAWIIRLNDQYPGDVGVLSPLLLNVICLQPGEALFLPAGQLHAYLDGLGIELMANSDNVLRGGLTPKHIDVAELLRILDFKPRPLEVLAPLPGGTNEHHYPSQAAEFILSVVRSSARQPVTFRPRSNTPEILLCTQGSATLAWGLPQSELEVKKGESVFVPAAMESYQVSGEAVLYKAAVNLDEFVKPAKRQSAP